MTDNRTTELTATERICEQLEAAGVSFVRSEQIIESTYWGVTWLIGETKFEFRENDKRTDLIAFNATPEQAIAATLGSERENIEKTENGYRAEQPVEVIESAIRSWGNQLGEHIMKRLCEVWNIRADSYPYEQRITGDGSDWGEIMIDAYDDLIAAACESCTPEQMRQLADHIRAELWSGTCEMVTSGTLTAEQVREVVYRNSTYNDIYKVHQVSRTDMQAIADELNAELCGGTCEFVDCGICKFYHADIQLCEYGIPPCSKFERKAVERWRCSE